MQYVRQAGSDPAFLLKAMSEASGELRRCFSGLRRRQLLLPGKAADDGWTMLGIAVHLRDTELGIVGQLQAILSSREPEIANVDIDDIPFVEDYRDVDEEEALDGFHYYRRHTSYTLWDLGDSQWQRGGLHPYRGRITVLDIARETYQHDLEHLWQARRMLLAMSSR
ncbi:MAG: DinB family protein [Chloroflexi bacterium]|nr:DinB family protein [Chloroflexota bacterium]